MVPPEHDRLKRAFAWRPEPSSRLLPNLCGADHIDAEEFINDLPDLLQTLATDHSYLLVTILPSMETDHGRNVLKSLTESERLAFPALIVAHKKIEEFPPFLTIFSKLEQLVKDSANPHPL